MTRLLLLLGANTVVCFWLFSWFAWVSCFEKNKNSPILGWVVWGLFTLMVITIVMSLHAVFWRILKIGQEEKQELISSQRRILCRLITLLIPHTLVGVFSLFSAVRSLLEDPTSIFLLLISFGTLILLLGNMKFLSRWGGLWRMRSGQD